MATTQQLIKNIKRELKRQGINYSMLANKVGVSESAIKKMFAKGNFSLDRLDQIFEVLDVDLLEMVENVNHQQNMIDKLTVSQEARLVKDQKLLMVAYAAINFWSVEDILHRYNLSREEVMEKAEILENFGILEIRRNQKIRPLISNNFRWLPDGPLSVFFSQYFLPHFFDSDFTQPDSLREIRFGDLTDESRVKLDRKCHELVDLYDKLTYEDRHFTPGNRERKGTTLVVAYRCWITDAFREFAID
ncbi:MAG: helix-turn-helix domain-containing protein [Gammaproteobacteria bacterium]|nr:helix-turn-helix domain-containing protein [Gammaproteobacteria bacterium]